MTKKNQLLVFKKDFKGATDEKGRHHAKLIFKGKPSKPGPVFMQLNLEVIDINRQTLYAPILDFIVHPCKYYVGIKHEKVFLSRKPFEVDIVVADVDGNLVPGINITLKIATTNPVTQKTVTLTSEKKSFKIFHGNY